MRGLNKEKVASLKNAFVMSEEKRSMFKMQHKRKLMRRLAAFTAVTLIILGTLLSGLITQTGSLKEKEQELAEAKSTLSGLEQQQKQSEEELVRLQDDEYIAELARKDYFLSDDGEIIFNIPEENENVQNTEQ
ncbi:septum formation initiator family protein [Domibacillus sp. A3M-37]|uniref:FtsB family cell division protein n=1 Tax=Domibacillus TaxID=1433999 RepID=UPI0006182DA1|nr:MULTISPECIES: septum formation initiator family protein [Domibacillus]MCP3764510.1 septum formation initiator family protein [Domibacillus sp. A3M-37]